MRNTQNVKQKMFYGEWENNLSWLRLAFRVSKS